MNECEKCLCNEVCDRSSRQMWQLMAGEDECSDYKDAAKYAEVIRCKDCEKWNSDHYCERAAVVELPPLLEAILYQTAPDDFCSRAVRRTNNETEQQTAAEPAG